MLKKRVTLIFSFSYISLEKLFHIFFNLNKYFCNRNKLQTLYIPQADHHLSHSHLYSAISKCILFLHLNLMNKYWYMCNIRHRVAWLEDLYRKEWTEFLVILVLSVKIQNKSCNENRITVSGRNMYCELWRKEI